MKFILLPILALVCSTVSSQNISKGKIITAHLLAPSIQGNPGGEEPMRRITIYLPPGYDNSRLHYPVIYFLHGFTRNDSFCIAVLHINDLLDKAIAAGKIRPAILVLPNSYTTFKGSFYTNSPLTGNWADFIAKDVVSYIDKQYRTLPNRNSRGLCGHSMGGNGAIKIGMLYSDVFSCIYALSPARLDWGEGLTSNSKSFKTAQASNNIADLSKDFFALEVTDLARTYSPNKNKPPFYADFPYEYYGDSMVTNADAVKKWNDNFPINMIDSHLDALKSLKALKLDWGRNDQFTFIPPACLRFSKKLEADSITHFAEEYIGDHSNKLSGGNGRIYTELLPFFDRYLTF